MSHPPYAPVPVPPKPRPRARWFVVGGALLVLAVAVFAGSFVVILRPLTQEDGIVAAGDGPVTVAVPPGEERALFTRAGEPAECTVTDAEGERVELEPVTGDFTYDEWTADDRFDTGAGDVVLDCTSTVAGAEVRVGQAPSTGAFVVGLLVGILGSIALGLAGFVVLLVTGILYVVRPPRPRESAQS
ncbi:hypothetical protein [Nocardioides sp.]|uniref:hypothetical protein n=1 Tax=Nocardioides sp. TaxID=35761 RepID=UPI0027284D75|nr:hypothetical protein [Nocardioides sp.]MDO9458019.1 hypothetical protein [Nocardioides sp.]